MIDIFSVGFEIEGFHSVQGRWELYVEKYVRTCCTHERRASQSVRFVSGGGGGQRRKSETRGSIHIITSRCGQIQPHITDFYMEIEVLSLHLRGNLSA